jgi:hypothetical protein
MERSGRSLTNLVVGRVQQRGQRVDDVFDGRFLETAGWGIEDARRSGQLFVDFRGLEGSLDVLHLTFFEKSSTKKGVSFYIFYDSQCFGGFYRSKTPRSKTLKALRALIRARVLVQTQNDTNMVRK